ncbi:DUF3826 domain-containing protein [Hymenobacter busanensis]|uniref:DUF3826 domain-containing protein n=1 Tax=Hymenobacter busanensis TaxID=2607656 RepID=A0A7L4ZTM0_9BACT|nr:DUF3826 domain-containing protein [Hymenobacter busanensis]KAA9339521.1 DUF3826 domain-containing protein [Hymenobacter busanensis]QHJ06724.1 DUF3826 domain-containing protein [Hymenobacter busanensis]
MFHLLRSLPLIGLLTLASATLTTAQTAPAETPEAAYTRTINERAAKIVATLGEADAKKAGKVQDIIAGQYRQLSELDKARKAQLATLKAKPQDAATAEEIKQAEAKAAAAVDKLHQKYLSKLGHYLTAAQVEKVKDGMTYSVTPNTYRAYQAMLPNLTEAQKTQILAWLVEAREKAMDAGTSEQKHAWFGKYKGKINNYLSAAGIDMKQAGKDWEARRVREADGSAK